MNKKNLLIALIILMMALTGCDITTPSPEANAGHTSGMEEPVVTKGPHGGKLLVDGDFSLELAIFETGVPPQYRAWVSRNGVPVAPERVNLQVTLTRLGNRLDEIGFSARDDFLQGDMVIYEPHSFEVSISAEYQGAVYTRHYENFEGRTRIGAEVARAYGLETLSAGPAIIKETVSVYGRINANSELVRSVVARFDGVLQSVSVSLGDTVGEGQPLVTIESNESLNSYGITAPISGVVTTRNANPGEQTNGRTLFTIVDNSSVWAELSLFPKDRARVVEGAPVLIKSATDDNRYRGTVSRVGIVGQSNQTVTARVVLENPDASLIPGMFVTGDIIVAEHSVPLAVKRSGLQPFRDFTVVYAQIGEDYEVRMLDLGLQDADWIEVLGGLDPGTTYVTTNSYLIKADIEKSGASHDH